ncbi:MAG: glycosyltransferase family 39 protein [Nitrospirae bacterium]|nr:glycosyltransferase family 39 protein [Nitrospirota bacterium]MBI4847274.1 glycosyltransferase family 39 protein [Nitrospirota bacterium]
MSQRSSFLSGSKKLPLVIIASGIIFRVVQYLHNTSLCLDEARDVVAGILGRSFSDFFKAPPDIYTPTPPAGFLIIEKLVTLTLGDSEYALRLIPLLVSVLSLFLFYSVAKQYIKPKAVPIALVFFAVLEPLIYYSAQVKPYTIDIASALLLFMAAIHIRSKALTFAHIITFGVLGSVVVWFSSPSVFVLAGVGTVLIVSALTLKDRKKVIQLLLIFLFWIAGFAAHYLFYLSKLTNEYMLNAARGEECFMPFPPASFSDMRWYITAFFNMFEETAGFYYAGSIAAFLFLVGCYSMALKERHKFFILISPLPLVLIASGLSLYAFKQRIILFLMPSLLFFISEGIEEIGEKTSQNMHVIKTLLIGLLFFHPILAASLHLYKPVSLEHEEVKPVLNYIRKNWQDGDVLYLHYRVHPAFTYYSKRYDFRDGDYIVGDYAGDKDNQWAFSPDYLRVYTNDINKLQGKNRVWMLFTYTPLLHKGIDERIFFEYYLNTIGKQLDFIENDGPAVYLYDLSGKIIDSHTSSDKRNPLHWNF